MKEFGVHLVHTDLSEEPESQIEFDSSDHCYTLMNPQGNALFLLHFLITTGAVRFRPEARPSQSELALLNQNKLSSETYYDLFFRIYTRPVECLTVEHISLLDSLLSQLEVSRRAQIRVLGELLCNQGQNDYFTLKLISSLKAGGLKLEVILSAADFKYLAQSSQAHSFRNMKSLLDKQIIQAAVLIQAYEAYASTLKLVSLEIDDLGTHFKYSHGGVNPMDVYRAALCLIDPTNQKSVEGVLSEEDRDYLLLYQSTHHPRNQDTPLDNASLAHMVTILNTYIQNLAKEKRLLEVLNFRLTLHDYDFGKGYNRKDILQTVYPFRMFFSDHPNPDRRMEGSNIPNQSSFYNIHAHEKMHSKLIGNSKEQHEHSGATAIHVSKVSISPRFQVALPKIAAAAVLILGVTSLVVAAACTGGVGSFFALGALTILGQAIPGLPLAAVGLASLLTYCGVSYRLNPHQNFFLPPREKESMITWSEVGGFYLRNFLC